MIAIGCLLLVILPLAGFVLGLLLAGMKMAIAIAAGGLVIALIVCGVTGYALSKAGRRG